MYLNTVTCYLIKQEGYKKERYEDGFRMSKDQATALSEASAMATFLKNALLKFIKDGDLNADIIIDGLFQVIQDLDRRLTFAVLEDTQEFKARQAA